MWSADLLYPVLQDGERDDHVKRFCGKDHGVCGGEATVKRPSGHYHDDEQEQGQHPADGNTRCRQSQREGSLGSDLRNDRECLTPCRGFD